MWRACQHSCHTRLVLVDRDLDSAYIVEEGMWYSDSDYMKPGTWCVLVIFAESRMLLVFGCGCGDEVKPAVADDVVMAKAVRRPALENSWQALQVLVQ